MQLDKWQTDVLNASGNLCICAGRQSGKSTVVAIKAADFAAKQTKKRVLIVSVTEKQAEEMLLKVLIYLSENYKNLIKKGKDRPTKHKINLTNGSQIRCEPVGQSGAGIRGFTIDMLICDEAAFMPDQVFTAVTPMLLTTGGDIILISTPNGTSGYFWKMYNSEQFQTFHINSETVANERTGKLKENMWKILEQAKIIMSAKEYEAEYLAVFVQDLYRLFPDELIEQACVLKRQVIASPVSEHYLGVDVARLGGDQSTFQTIEKMEVSKHRDSRIETKTRIPEIVQIIKTLDSSYHYKQILIDTAGVGGGVYDMLELEQSFKYRILSEENATKSVTNQDESRSRRHKEDMYINLLRMLENKELFLLGDDEVKASLREIQYEYVKDKGSKSRLRIFGKRHDHIAEGLIRAAWGARGKKYKFWVASKSYGIGKIHSYDQAY